MEKVHLIDDKYLLDSIEKYEKDDVANENLDKQRLFMESPDQIPFSQGLLKITNRSKEERSDRKCDFKTRSEAEAEVLLGSVTTHTNNCVGTRSSARVIQKMKQDQQTHPGTPPHERDSTARKEERSMGQKTPTQVRVNKPSWSNMERNYFFDALNEFGKDFEAIGNYINAKLKRRSPATDITFKSKDQVRQHFYQTYHKICKYIRFSEEVRKPVQELYALINYGEMRRKIQFVSEKHFLKLRNLVYDGHVAVRCKGKNIRLKTPSCKALRRLNQLDDSLEDIKLPSKIEVIVSPANMETFGRIQSIAQNPRCRTTVPLHKKLINFIKAFQHKWRSYDCKLIEEAKLLNGDPVPSTESNIMEPELCFLPKPGVTIHRPLLSITEYLSSVNICLTAYEERMGVKIKGITLNTERNAATSSTPTAMLTQQSPFMPNKRTRTDSGSDKRSPEQMKRSKTQESSIYLMNEESPSDNDILQKNESSGDELGDEIQELLSDYAEMLVNNKNDPLPEEIFDKSLTEIKDINKTMGTAHELFGAANSNTTSGAVRSVKRSLNAKSSKLIFKPLLNDDVIQSIRNGWTINNAGDITIGDLYVVFGHDGKLELDYYWPNSKQNNINLNTESIILATGELVTTATETENDLGPLTAKLEGCTLSNKLKHLLLIANLSERLRKRSCTCERNANAKSRLERDFGGRTYLANKIPVNSSNNDGQLNTFKSPLVPLRRPPIDPVKQLTNLTRPKMSRQVLVQRLLVPNSDNAGNLNNENTATDEQPSANPSEEYQKTDVDDTSIIPADDMGNVVKLLDGDSDDMKTNTIPQSEEVAPTSSVISSIINKPPPPPTNVNVAAIVANGQVSVQEMPPSSVDSAFDECSNISFLNGLSPLQHVRDSTSNSRWLEENLNDFSLTSLLGHLDEINASRDILDPSSNLSVISENSVDYINKFQEIKALLQSQDKD